VAAAPARRRALAVRGATLALALVVAACTRVRPPVVPMPTLALPAARAASDGVASDCLVVLLPGRYDDMGDFADAGFHEAVAARGLRVDLLAADAHLGYYFARTVVKRLREDVVEPARARGYRHVWLAGTSLGGIGAIAYLREASAGGQPAGGGVPGLDGIFLIAPYLGEEPMLDEIERAGGVARWHPPPVVETADFQRQLWTALSSWARDGGAPAPVWLGFGDEDPFARSHRLLATALPPGRVLVARGDHDWDTWAELWRAFLAGGALDGCRGGG
jgi:hypothetical protein